MTNATPPIAMGPTTSFRKSTPSMSATTGIR